MNESDEQQTQTQHRSVERRSQTVTRVEAVEEELAICPNCEQTVEDDDLVTVGVDMRDVSYRNSNGKEPVVNEPLCKHCANAIFGYERTSPIVGSSLVPYYIEWRRNVPQGVFAKIGYVTATVLLGLFLLVMKMLWV